MTNSVELEKRIHDSGLRKSWIMEQIGIKSYATLRAKIKNNSEFTASEIDKLCEILNLNKTLRGEIFFASVAE